MNQQAERKKIEIMEKIYTICFQQIRNKGELNFIKNIKENIIQNDKTLETFHIDTSFEDMDLEIQLNLRISQELINLNLYQRIRVNNKQF